MCRGFQFLAINRLRFRARGWGICACRNRRVAPVNGATTFCANSSGALTAGKLFAAFLLVTALAGCVTGTTIPNSPFLTAVVKLNPAVAGSRASAGTASNASSPLDANAAATDLPLRGSLSASAPTPVAGAPPQRTPPPAPFVARSRSVRRSILSSPRLKAIWLLPLLPRRAAGRAQAAERCAGARRKNRVARRSRRRRGAQPSLDGRPGGRGEGSLADVRTAQGALKPQFQVFAGSGGSYLGSYQNYPHQFSSTLPSPAVRVRMPGSRSAARL